MACYRARCRRGSVCVCQCEPGCACVCMCVWVYVRVPGHACVCMGALMQRPETPGGGSCRFWAQRLARLPLTNFRRGCLSSSRRLGLSCQGFSSSAGSGRIHFSSHPYPPPRLTFLSSDFEDLRALAWVKMPEVGTVFLCKGGRQLRERAAAGAGAGKEGADQSHQGFWLALCSLNPDSGPKQASFFHP